MNRQLPRRSFLIASTAGLFTSHRLFATNARPAEIHLDENQTGKAKRASEIIVGKDDRLIVLADDPAVFETPIPLLWQTDLTPAELLFVRNNQQPKNALTVEPFPARDWQIRIDGLVNRPVEVSLEKIREFESVSYEMVLQCSGNGRELFTRRAKTSGTQWGRGGFGNVRFTGPRLSTLLEGVGVESKPEAKFILANGMDTPIEGKEDFLHSLPVDEVLNRSILALSLNDKPLPAIHGGPIRLITPGVFGTMQIKWLSSLTFQSEETLNENHASRYRVPHSIIEPGSDFEVNLSNSRFNWNLNVKSVLLHPLEGAKVPAGEIALQGVAFNDGSARIDSVLISTDLGRTWFSADLTIPASRFAWTRFTSRVKLEAGEHEIWVRASDALGRSQPLDGSVFWNPHGYEWNGVEKIKFLVT